MGGGPTMYRYQTPSGDKTMDGQAMALRAGLPLRDMEMVQFHPTGLLAGDHTRMTGTVLEEGLRGAGGILLNGDGERFMFGYDERGERATRDIVSRAIYDEMRKGNTTPQGGVHIAMSHLGPDNVAQKFAGMVKRCADCGFDLAGGLVEVVPTAHYFMGGVVVDTDTRTALPGLYVAGEDAGGAHGANRLGGNGVANSTVYGGIAGDVMGRDIALQTSLRDPDRDGDRGRGGARHAPGRTVAKRPGSGRYPRAARELQNAMWDDVGVIRTKTGMTGALAKLDAIEDELMQTGIAGGNLAFNLTWHDWLNLRNLVDMSKVIAEAALMRENSRGAHFREDFPDTGALAESYFTNIRQSGEDLKVTREAVAFTIVRPGETVLPDDEPESLVG